MRHFYSELEDRGILAPRVLLLQECEGLLAAVKCGEELRAAVSDVAWKHTDGESFGHFRYRAGRPLRALDHPVLQRAVEGMRENLEVVCFSGGG